MNANEDKLIARLFKDTLIINLLSLFASRIGDIIDGIVTGKFLGTEAMAAFGLTIPYQRFVIIFPAVLALGMQILCSRALGRGDLRESNGNFSSAVTTALALMILLTGTTFLFAEQLANLLDAGESLGVIRSLTVDYLQSFSLSLPAMALVSVLTPIMQLDGDRNRAIFATVVLSVSDIVADLVCVFVFDGGLWGIGLATAVSYWIAAGVLLLHFVKPNASFAYLPESMHVKSLGEMFLAGMTMIIGRGSSVLCSSILTRISLATAGGVGVAAFAAVINLSVFLEMVPKALGSSTQMIGGLFIGEQDKPSLLRLMKISLKYSPAISAIMTPIVFLAAPTIADLYVRNAD